MRFYRIRNEQAPHDHFVMVVVAFAMAVLILVFGMAVLGFIRVIVMHIDHGELDRIDSFTKRDDLGLVCTGVV